MRFQGSVILFKVTWNLYVSCYNKFILNSETAYIELDNCQNTKPKNKKVINLDMGLVFLPPPPCTKHSTLDEIPEIM